MAFRVMGVAIVEIRVRGALDLRVHAVSVEPSQPEPRQVLGLSTLRAAPRLTAWW